MKLERSTGGVEVVSGVEAPEAARAAKRRRVAPAAARRGGGVERRARRRVQAQPTAVQRLFAACRAVFKGPGTVPAPADVDLLRGMLDKMRPEDVGLSSNLEFLKARDAAAEGTPTITQTTIYKCENFSIEIFFLPPTAVIPLHNHPGMTVFSKLLLGSMHIKSYDWVDPAASTPTDQLRLARLVLDDVFTAPCGTSVLFPAKGGNMHRFMAIEPCAVLDVLGPPYSVEEDRDCTYYADFLYSHHSNGVADLAGEQKGRLGWLKEIDMPRDLKMDRIKYRGPTIFGT